MAPPPPPPPLELPPALAVPAVESGAPRERALPQPPPLLPLGTPALPLAGPMEMAPQLVTPVPTSSDDLHKCRLHAYTQRAALPIPIYKTLTEGLPHLPHHRGAVIVNRLEYISPNLFSDQKEAEQDAAKLALESINMKDKEKIVSYLKQDAQFSKSILNEYAAKVNIKRPLEYSTTQKDQAPKAPTFISSVVIGERTYVGRIGKNKKKAEQNAACAAVLGILESSGKESIDMLETVRTKDRMFVINFRCKSNLPYEVSNGASEQSSVEQLSSQGTNLSPSIQRKPVGNLPPPTPSMPNIPQVLQSLNSEDVGAGSSNRLKRKLQLDGVEQTTEEGHRGKQLHHLPTQFQE